MRTDLFVRQGRHIQVTDAGRMVMDYADERFSLGWDLHQSLANRTTTRPVPVAIGISDAVSKLIACRMVSSAVRLPDPVQVTIYEDCHEALLQRLSTHMLDMVVSDAPLDAHLRIRPSAIRLVPVPWSFSVRHPWPGSHVDYRNPCMAPRCSPDCQRLRSAGPGMPGAPIRACSRGW
jgi:LysR family transcriptional activator of nhaA